MTGLDHTVGKPLHLLLIEDNRMDVELTLDAFRRAGVNSSMYVASNGQIAIDYLNGVNDYADRRTHPIPDLILLDLKMPGMDGHEVLRRIKSTQGLRRLPVVILTSSKEERDLSLSYDSGANSYLVKPLSFDGFLDMVHKVGEYWMSLNVNAPINT